MDLIMSNYSFKSMTEQANAIKKNLISPVKLLEEFFENISAEKKSDQILLKSTLMKPWKKQKNLKFDK